MKRLVQIFGWGVFVGVLLLAGVLLYSTASGQLTWYFRVNGQVMVDGQETTGYLHANMQKTLLMLTRTDDARPETYLVSLGDERAVLDCGEWRAIRFLPFPVGDVSPPCSTSTVAPAKFLDPPVAATRVRAARSVEFSTASGKKVRGEW